MSVVGALLRLPPIGDLGRAFMLNVPLPLSVDNVRVGNVEVGARRRLAPTGSTPRVKPDGA